MTSVSLYMYVLATVTCSKNPLIQNLRTTKTNNKLCYNVKVRNFFNSLSNIFQTINLLYSTDIFNNVIAIRTYSVWKLQPANTLEH